MDKKIPEQFRSCFWDTEFENLDVEKQKSFIIPRLYIKGGIEGISWVHKAYSDDDIIEAAKRCRWLNPIVANYLQKLYNIDPNEMAYYRIEAAGARELWPY